MKKHDKEGPFDGSLWHNEFPNPTKQNDMKPKKEYLSKIQQDQEAIGARLKAIRIANGIELKDIAFRDKAICIERGMWGLVNNRGQSLSAHWLVQYCHEIGASLGPFNNLPEES